MYHFVYITNLPSFYKISLFNRIAKKRLILVVFTHESHIQRNEDFFVGEREFHYVSIANKSRLSKISFILDLLKNTHYQHLIIGGWDQLVLWVAAFKSPRTKNGVVIESSILESKTTGYIGLLKKLFISRISKAYCSGNAQKQLIKELNYTGEIIITKGVGIFNIVKQPVFYPKEQVSRFIYVGRLSSEKNLKYLINTFNDLPYLTLNIVGFGPLERALREIGNANIIFHGSVDNVLLPDYYNANDVLILPSLSETWGLVVEEALNNGLPVIVSENVGCSSEVVVQDYNGIIFSFRETDGLKKAILKMLDFQYYNTLRKNVSKMDFEKIAEEQVNCYL
jgi:glycosyltransferase involved in cell wall biosynthesis